VEPSDTRHDPVERLRAQLRDHAVIDERESRARVMFVAELDRLARPFDQDADPTHVTASAVVVGDRGVILHRHRRLRRWMQPGGHLEPGEAPEVAVVRECVEETGLAVSHPAGVPRLIHVDVHPAARGHVHLDLRYLMTAPDDDPSPGADESQDVAWFSWKAATAMADEALAGALRSARRLIGAPPSSAGHGNDRE
jgi:8-oxo-dGTP pyrophosphatase MutT (NUDIX family)